MSHELWTTVSANEVYNNGRGLTIRCEEVRLPDGRVISDFYQVELPSHVTIYATTAEGMVVCLRQYKHGPRKVALTLPGGLMNGDEDPMQAARRELLEETGFVSDDWTSLGGFTIGGNQGIGTAHLFQARKVQKAQAPASGDLEYMQLEYHDRESILAELRSGSFPILAHATAIALANIENKFS